MFIYFFFVVAQTILDPVFELKNLNLPLVEHDTVCEPEVQKEFKHAAVQVTSDDIFR